MVRAISIAMHNISFPPHRSSRLPASTLPPLLPRDSLLPPRPPHLERWHATTPRVRLNIASLPTRSDPPTSPATELPPRGNICDPSDPPTSPPQSFHPAPSS
ncbi:hypothetical protein M8J77_007735 [Diaphorina citri]|nr:hypothetical protein M8J77_007735 [Diaphorina citri]